jgi:serine protease AprX
MQKLSSITLLFLLAFQGLSQTAPSKYWIQFTDKANSPYSISSPDAYLTQRSIDRRQKQSIAIDQKDIPVNQHYIDSILASGQITLLNRSRWFNAITVWSVDTLALDSIQNFGFVSQVRSVRTLKSTHEQDEKLATDFQKSEVPNYYPGEYGAGFNQISMLKGHLLHEKGYRGEGMMIAVIDAGYLFMDTVAAFDQLRAENRILGTRDFVQIHDNVYDDHWHGMYVMGAMTGFIEGEFMGTAPKASYWLLRSEEASSEYIIEEDNWVAAAEFADSVGADVINTSLGYTTFDDSTQNHSYADLDGNTTRITIGSDIAAAKGMLLVTSAGNSGEQAWTYISAPADADSTLTVGAVDPDGQYAPFSSQGPSADGRVKPNVAAQGGPAVLPSQNGGVVNAGGTSFSSPITAGLAACLWQAHPTKTNMEIIHAIEETGSQYTNPDGFLGYGIPNFYKAHILLLGGNLSNYDEDEIYNIYPTLFTDHIKVELYNDQKQEVIFELVNINGKVVHQYTVELEGEAFCTVAIRDELTYLAAGTYILRMISNTAIYTSKLVKY